MARSRNLKPGYFKNEALAELPPLTRILFSGLWCLADRSGRLEDRPKRIRAEVLPYDDGNVDGMLDELHRAGFILRYEVDLQRFIQVVNFGKHQTPHHKEPASTIPAPDKPGASPRQVPVLPKSSRADSLDLIPDPLDLIPDPLNLIPPTTVGEVAPASAVASPTPPRSGKSAKGTRLPDNWQPSDELHDWARNTRPDLDIELVVEKFRDFWHAKAGKDGLKASWDSAFRTWVRNESAPAGRANGGARGDATGTSRMQAYEQLTGGGSGYRSALQIKTETMAAFGTPATQQPEARHERDITAESTQLI